MISRIAGFNALERLEPCAGKLACTVLRGACSSNAACLLDFAFVGNQIPIMLQDNEYFIDMLFYHLKLHCYVVVELKATKFKPEHTGQLNFYLNLVDDFFKAPEDKPSIGILLCKSRNKFEAEYALKGIQKPIGISEYQLTRAIPENLKLNF